MDKTSSDGDGEVQKALKPLKEDDVKIVPVAVGPDADRNQLKNITSTDEYLVDAKKSTTPEKLAEEIMDKVTSGRKHVGFWSSYCVQFDIHARRQEVSLLHNFIIA